MLNPPAELHAANAAVKVVPEEDGKGEGDLDVKFDAGAKGSQVSVRDPYLGMRYWVVEKGFFLSRS